MALRYTWRHHAVWPDVGGPHAAGRKPISDIAVVIATFGDPKWHTRGIDLAEQIVEHQTVQASSVFAVHADTLAEARNHGGYDSYGTYIVFLDADDNLDEHFIESMSRRTHFKNLPKNIIYRPSIRGYRGNFEWLDDAPLMFEKHPLLTRNYLPIGSMVSRHAFKDTMFEEWECLEDWALWLDLVTNGNCIVEDVPDATYLINDDHDRNQHPDIDLIANRIRSKYRWAYFQCEEYQNGLANYPVRNR